MVVFTHESKSKIAFQYTAIIAGIVVVSQLGVSDLSLKTLAVKAYQNLANVSSVSASIPPNDLNVLASQFSQKETELTQREQDLLKRESALDAKYQEAIDANKRLTLYVLAGITLLLLLMIFLNFYFDIKREEIREEKDKDRDHSVPQTGFITKI